MMGTRSFSPLRQWMGKRTWIGASHVNKLILTASCNGVLRPIGSSQLRREATYYHKFAALKTICSICGHKSNLLTYRTWRSSLNNCRFYGRNTRMLNFRDCESVDDVLQLALDHIHQLRPNQIAAVWSSLARTLLKWRPHQQEKGGLRRYEDEAMRCELQILDICEVTMNHLDSKSPKELTTTTLAMAKIVQNIRNRPRKKHDPTQQAFSNVLFDENSSLNESIFYELAKTSNQMLPYCDARCLSNLAYSHALLEYDPELDDGSKLLTNIADETIGRFNEFNAQDISNLAWAYATMKIQNRSLFEAMGDFVSNMYDLKSFKPQELANIVWAYATANEKHPDLFRIVGDNIDSMLDLNPFDPQALSNIVWAYATANEKHPGLFRKIGDNIVSLKDLKPFDPQALSNIVWAYATADEKHTHLFNKVGDSIVAMKDLKSFKPQELSNLVWAYATTNIYNPDLFKKIGDNINGMKDLKSFKPQALSNIVWAYATVNIHHANLFRKIGDNIDSMKDLKSFNPQNLANIVWAYATANVNHPNLFQKIGDNIVGMKDLKSFNPQHVVNIVWAYATANVEHRALFDKVGRSIINLKILSSFNPQDLSNTAWAYSVLNINISELFSASFIEALVNNKDDLTNLACSQLYQWHLWQTQELSYSGLPQSLQEKCYQVFSSKDTTDSAFQRDVVAQLDAMGLHPVKEYLTNSGYSIDGLIELNGKKVGIEVDGPSHFIGRRQNGPTVLKHRQVFAIDKTPLVSVPYWEWDKLKKNRNKNQQYLQSLLETVK